MLKPNKIIICVLLIALLGSSFGSAFGCVYCDKGSQSDIHIKNHIDDHSDGHTDIHPEDLVDIHSSIKINGQEVSLDQHFRETGDGCFDLPLQFDSGLIEDPQHIKLPASLFAPIAINAFTDFDHVIVSETFLKPHNRTSQSILLHRTIVLLT